ncbi:MAG: hypothetical protein CSA54_00940 [Gammaproteobacteria bacterium]|nr:MAG: hypothetical protein CSA54_00940 [Gammaproteobacteria bacterium]
MDPVAGHIPGAANLPFTDNLTEEGRMLPPEVLRQRFGTDNIRSRLPAESRRKPLAHYCGSGVTAAHNVLAMRHAGLEPGALYAGSFSEWITRDGGQREVAHRVRE